MRSEEEISEKMSELKNLYLKLDRFKDVHKLDAVEGALNALRWVEGEHVHLT